MLQAAPAIKVFHEKTISNYLTGGTFVRLVLSLIVFFSHLGALTGIYKNRYFDSNFAVGGFFILSGFAMMNSYERLVKKHSPPVTLKNFYIQRFFRVVTPVWVLIILQVIIFFFFSRFSFSQYFFSRHTLQYILANFSFLNFLKPTLPGVFFERSNVINGSLWTLKIELQFYALFPLLYRQAVQKGRRFILPALWLLSVAGTQIFNGENDRLINQLPGQLTYFLSGMLLYQNYPLIKRSRYYFLIPYLGLALLLKMLFLGYNYIESAIYFPVVVVALCNFFRATESRIKNHDYSFTLYLIHWPIFKMAAFLFFDKGMLIQGISFVLMAVVILGFIIHQAELKAIQIGRHFTVQPATEKVA